MSGSPPILVPRPRPAAERTAERIAALGLAPVILPLFETRPVAWFMPRGKPYDALLISSANALRHGGINLARLTDLPVYAVGEATAEAAEAKGFTVAATGSGGIAGLEEPLRADGRTSALRLAGRDNRPFAPEGIAIDTVIVYAAEPIDIPPGSLRELPAGTVALLYSGRAAERFAELVDAAGIARAHFGIVAIAPSVAGQAGHGWAHCASAASPDESAMLSALEKSLESPPSTDPRSPPPQQDD